MNETIEKIFQHPLRIPVLVGLVSFGAGGGLGYILGRRRNVEQPKSDQLELEFDTNPVSDLQEISKAQTFVREKLSTDLSFLSDDAEVEEEIIEEQEIEVITTTIFAEDSDDWDYEKEVASRNTSEPHVIHKDEFYAEESGYEQITITYYAGDDIMADDKDVAIYNYRTITGPLLFGHGSGDPGVVYIRNDKNQAEYEVLKDEGHYAVEILGLEIENSERTKDLKHSSGPLKFKRD